MFKILYLILLSFVNSNLFAQKKQVPRRVSQDEDKTTIAGNIINLEDGNPNNKTSWTYIGPKSEDLGVFYISTDDLRKNVVQLKSYGLTGSFIFKNKDNNYFNYPGFFNLQLKMKYKNPFVIQVLVETNKGDRYLVYSNLDNKKINDEVYLHIGLGSTYIDGKWHTLTRNLNDDLQSFDESLQVKLFKGISFNGEGYIDDIWLLKNTPLNILIEDGEMNGLDAWDMVGKGGKISLDYDDYLGGTIFFNSGSDNAAFRLRKVDGSYWKIKTNVVVQWKMKMKEDFKFYVIGDTVENDSQGKYILSYESDDFAPTYIASSNIIRIGLGKNTVDNKWRVITRDLSDDIKLIKPGVDISSVSSMLFRGHGWIDDIKLLAEMPSESYIAEGWDIFDDNPDGASIRMFIDSEKGEVVNLKGEGLKNGFRYTGKYGKLAEPDSVFVRWDMKYDERFDIMLLVDTQTFSKVIHYIPEDLNYMKKDGNELFIGIGKTILDGRWHTVVRSLKDDLYKLDPNASPKDVKSFLVRGSGSFSNISFSKESFLIEKKETPSAVASVVLGQYDFSFNLRNLWGVRFPTKAGLNNPNGIYIDSNDNFLVADSGNSGVRMYRTIPLVNGTVSDDLLFSNTLKKPYSVAIAGTSIIVSDIELNKVFIFDKNIEEYTLKCEINSVSFNKPAGVFYDGVRLFIADSANHRILVWDSIPQKCNEDPSLVIGQNTIGGTKVNRGDRRPSLNSLNTPMGVYSTGESLIVADTNNNRVLYYNKIPRFNGWHADYVIGQKSKSDIEANMGKKASESSLNAPEGVFIDDNYIYVADTKNNRVLLYDKNIKTNTPKAIGIIGQVRFTESIINRGRIPSSDTLFYPSQLFVYNGIILVSDTANNRVLVY